MVTRFHYDDAVFERLLQDRLPPDEQQDVTQHVEGCTSCQSKLEVLAEQGIRWEDVRNFLKDREQSEITRDSNQANSSSVWIGFLEPSERPDSLGLFGRYEILEVLGRGGTGIVMRGHDPSLDRQCAIKVLSPELAASAAARKRFSREAKSAAAVVHEHVVPIQTVEEEQGLPYLVMPVLEGRSLEDRVRKNGPLDVKEILRVGRQIASGLAAAHAQGLIHRDVKPANILLNHGVERVVITDFGLARAADDASMTQSGTLVGTPQYMSPEQAKGESLDVRSDLFSLGSVLYFMSTGHSPFRAETTMGILNRITSDTPRSLTEHNPEIPQWFDQIVRKLLAKRPEDRYATAADVEKLLGDWLAHLQDPARVPRPADPKTSEGNGRSRIAKWIAAALGGIFLLWAGITVVLETGKGTLTIENHADDIAVRIKKGDKVYDQLTVKKGENKVRLAAGKYVVEIDGKHDGISIENGAVTLTRGDQKLVQIVEDSGVASDENRLFHNIGISRNGNDVGVPANSSTAKPQADPNNSLDSGKPLSGGEQTLGQGKPRFSRFVPESVEQPSRSQIRPDFHSDVAKIMGDWIEVESPTHSTRMDPLRLRFQDGRYVFRWSEKSVAPSVTQFIGGTFTLNTDQPTIKMHPTEGATSATIETRHRFSGTYNFDGEHLVIEIDKAEMPPGFLPETIPATLRFQRSTESPSTFIAGVIRSEVPTIGNQRPRATMLENNLVNLPDIDLETELQGNWTAIPGAAPGFLTSNNTDVSGRLGFFGRELQNTNRPVIDLTAVVDATQGWGLRRSGTYLVNQKADEKTITIQFNSRDAPTTLSGTYQIDGDQLTIDWDASTNADFFTPPDMWKFKRGIRLPEPNGSGNTVYADAIMTATPRLFTLFQYRQKPTYTVLSQVNLNWDHHQFDPTWEVTSLVSEGYPIDEYDQAVGAFRIRGENITSLVAIDTQGRFREHLLKETFSGVLQPVLEDDLIYYIVNGTVYAFSGRTGTWDQLDDTGLGTLNSIDGSIAVPQTKDGFDTETINGIIVRKADDIFVFRVETGKWEKVDAYPKEEPLPAGLGNVAGAEAARPDSQKLLNELRSETKIQFLNTPLPLVLSYLEKLHKIVIVLDHDAFDEAKIAEGVEVSCNFLKGTLAEGLRSVLEPYGLRYVVRNGQIVITTIPEGHATRPALKVEFLRSGQFALGKPILVRAKLTNVSDTAVTDVVIREVVDPQLKITARTAPAEDEHNTIQWKFPRILPNQQAILEVECEGKDSPGNFTNHLLVTAKDFNFVLAARIQVGEPNPEDALPPSEDPFASPVLPKPHEQSGPNQSPPSNYMPLQGSWNEITGVKSGEQTLHRPLRIQGDQMTISWHVMPPVDDSGTYYFGAAHTSVGGKLTLDEKAGTFTYLAQKKASGELAAKKEFIFNFTLKGEFKLADDELTLKIKEAENAPPTLIRQELPVTLRYRRVGEPTLQDSSSGSPLNEDVPKTATQIDSTQFPSVRKATTQSPGPIEDGSQKLSLKALRGTWMQVEDFNPRPDGVVGRSGLRPLSLMITGSHFSINRFRDDDGRDVGIRGEFKLGPLDRLSSPIEMKFQAKEVGPVDLFPTSDKQEFAHSIKGTIHLAGNHLTVRISEGSDLPSFFDPLPIEWKFVRTIPVNNPNNRPPTASMQSPATVVIPPVITYPQPNLPESFKELNGQWIQAEKVGEKGLGGMRLTLEGDRYRLIRDHNSQGVRYQLGGTFDAAEGADESPNTIYFSHAVRGQNASYYLSPAHERVGVPLGTLPTFRDERSFSGTYELEGDRLTLHIDKGPHAPDFIGEIPATWFFHRPPGTGPASQ